MPVVPLTLTISLTLVFTFVVFFLREHARGRMSSAERDSLLPLAEENTRLARVPAHGAPAASAAIRPARPAASTVRADCRRFD